MLGNPLQYSCLEKSHGWKSPVSYNPWGRKESDTTERLHFTILVWIPVPWGQGHILLIFPISSPSKVPGTQAGLKTNSKLLESWIRLTNRPVLTHGERMNQPGLLGLVSYCAQVYHRRRMKQTPWSFFLFFQSCITLQKYWFRSLVRLRSQVQYSREPVSFLKRIQWIYFIHKATSTVLNHHPINSRQCSQRENLTKRMRMSHSGQPSPQLEKSQEKEESSSTYRCQYIFICKKEELALWKWKVFLKPHFHMFTFPFPLKIIIKQQTAFR